MRARRWPPRVPRAMAGQPIAATDCCGCERPPRRNQERGRRTKPKIAQRTSECISGLRVGSNGRKTHRSRRRRSQRPAGPVRARSSRNGSSSHGWAPNVNQAAASVAPRHATSRRAPGGTSAGSSARAATTTPSRTCGARSRLSHVAVIAIAGRNRGEKRPTHVPPLAAPEPRARRRDRRHAARRRSGCRAPPAGGGPARHGRPPREARSVDPDDGDEPSRGEREDLREAAGIGRRSDDGELPLVSHA